MLEATSFDNSAKNIAKVPKDLPVIFVSGDRDPVGNLGKGVKTAYEKFAARGYAGCDDEALSPETVMRF